MLYPVNVGRFSKCKTWPYIGQLVNNYYTIKKCLCRRMYAENLKAVYLFCEKLYTESKFWTGDLSKTICSWSLGLWMSKREGLEACNFQRELKKDIVCLKGIQTTTDWMTLNRNSRKDAYIQTGVKQIS